LRRYHETIKVQQCIGLSALERKTSGGTQQSAAFGSWEGAAMLRMLQQEKKPVLGTKSR
jgi:hypothetical protein